jgi:hypothetical protein
MVKLNLIRSNIIQSIENLVEMGTKLEFEVFNFCSRLQPAVLSKKLLYQQFASHDEASNDHVLSTWRAATQVTDEQTKDKCMKDVFPRILHSISKPASSPFVYRKPTHTQTKRRIFFFERTAHADHIRTSEVMIET